MELEPRFIGGTLYLPDGNRDAFPDELRTQT